MHAKETRLGVATKTDADGHMLKTYIEMDFSVTSGGDERISNSYSPRMRHAFLSYDNWLFGQTWSTFMNVGTLPETLDFIGNTDGAVFVRQARYTMKAATKAMTGTIKSIFGGLNLWVWTSADL